jgi:hypothetical protein
VSGALVSGALVSGALVSGALVSGAGVGGRGKTREVRERQHHERAPAPSRDMLPGLLIALGVAVIVAKIHGLDGLIRFHDELLRVEKGT